MRKPATLLLSALLAGIAGGAPARADAPPEPLSLDRAVALALARNPGYLATHADVVAAGAGLRAAAGPKVPVVALRDDFAYATPVAELSTPFGALPFSSTTTTNVPQLTVRYSLFDGGRTAAAVSRAAAALAAADARERAARMALIDATITAYFDLVAAFQSAAVGDRAVDVAQAHLSDAQHLFDAGQVPHADVLRARTELANERMRSLIAHDAVALAQTRLDDAIGAGLGDLHQPTDALDAAAPDMALRTLLDSAPASRGDVAAARAALDAAGDALREARAAREPRIDAVVVDGNVQPAVASGYRNQFSVGLDAVWTLFDNGTGAGDVAAARAGIARARLDLERQERDAELQVRQAYLQFVDAKARVAASQTLVALADENVRLAAVRYRGGVGTLLELQDAELRATSARQELIAAQVAVREGIVHVRFAAGLL
jgi:outer membrane protein